MYDTIIELTYVSLYSDLLLFLCIVVVLGWCAWHIRALYKKFNHYALIKRVEENAKDQNGFSLLELVTITAIIATLAIIAIPQFAKYRDRAYNDAMVSDLRTAITCQEAYFTDHQTYTTDEATLIAQYNMYQSRGVDVQLISADSQVFVMEARHDATTTVYTYSGPGGSISKK